MDQAPAATSNPGPAPALPVIRLEDVFTAAAVAEHEHADEDAHDPYRIFGDQAQWASVPLIKQIMSQCGATKQLTAARVHTNDDAHRLSVEVRAPS